MFSIIIPVYNKAKYIAGAIESIRAQSFDQWEIVIVDDGSTDDFASAIAPYIDDPKIQIIRKQNGGVSTARNTGIQAAKYDYCCFLDADDEWTSDHLECTRELILQHPDANMFVTGHKSVFDGEDEGYCPPFARSGIHRTSDMFDYVENLNGNMPFWTGCTCVTKKAIAKSGMFEPGVRIGEDTDFFLRIALYTDVALTDHVTSIYHMERSSAVSQMGRMNYDWIFQHREEQLMADPEISDSMKKNIRCYISRFRNHKARHYLLEGKRDQAREELKKIHDDPRLRKSVLITRCMMFFPTKILRSIYLKKKERDLK